VLRLQPDGRGCPTHGREIISDSEIARILPQNHSPSTVTAAAAVRAALGLAVANEARLARIRVSRDFRSSFEPLGACANGTVAGDFTGTGIPFASISADMDPWLCQAARSLSIRLDESAEFAAETRPSRTLRCCPQTASATTRKLSLGGCRESVTAPLPMDSDSSIQPRAAAAAAVDFA
jgi:hypothetical protein